MWLVQGSVAPSLPARAGQQQLQSVQPQLCQLHQSQPQQQQPPLTDCIKVTQAYTVNSIINTAFFTSVTCCRIELRAITHQCRWSLHSICKPLLRLSPLSAILSSHSQVSVHARSRAGWHTGAQDREERLRAQREAALQSSRPTFTPAITAKGRTGGRSASVSTFERLHEDPMKEERR
jgi:hypothetical protein